MGGQRHTIRNKTDNILSCDKKYRVDLQHPTLQPFYHNQRTLAHRRAVTILNHKSKLYLRTEGNSVRRS